MMNTSFAPTMKTATVLARAGQSEPLPTRQTTLSVAPLHPPQPSSADSKDESDHRSDRELVRKLAASELFQDYQQAFREATGLPLTLRSVEDWQLAHTGDRQQNAFCALVAKQNASCAACLKMQQQVCNTANGVPATLKCSFGINETAVTVHLGERTIGYLQTGQVFFKSPTPAQTNGVINRLRELGNEVDPSEAATAYQATRVVRRQTYDSMIRLLEYFAKQLGLLANQILLQQRGPELPQVARARQYIHDHCQDDLSLGEVARHAAISPFYLCKKFKEATGLNFTEYVARIRVEKARELLRDPNHRVSEIAYTTGFQSLSHFNRCFRRITGKSPTACRGQLDPI